MNIKEEIQSKAVNPDKYSDTQFEAFIKLKHLFKEDGSGIIDRLEKENKELREKLSKYDKFYATKKVKGLAINKNKVK